MSSSRELRVIDSEAGHYHPEEHYYLSDWLGIPQPTLLDEIDIDWFIEGRDTSNLPDDEDLDRMLEIMQRFNPVSVLEGVDYTGMDAEEERFAHIAQERGDRREHLCSVIWYNSGVSYYLIHLPYYHVEVVVKTSDSTLPLVLEKILPEPEVQKRRLLLAVVKGDLSWSGEVAEWEGFEEGLITEEDLANLLE